MAIQVFWDANFKVKSLEPVMEEALGVVSPFTMLTGVPVTIVLLVDTKMVTLKRDVGNSGNNVTVQVSKTAAPGPYIAEPGAVTVDLDNGDMEIPTENLTAIIVTNNEAGSRDIPFICYVNS